MPQRASNQDIGTNVGKMIFHGQSAKRIEHTLGTVDKGKMKDALSRRGLGGKDHKEIAKVLSGEHRSGWRHSELKNLVEALQEVKIAKHAKSAGEMVLMASREAQLKANPGLTAGAIKARLKRIAQEQRSEAEAVPSEREMTVLDRMRGAAGRANKVDRASQMETPSADEPANKSVRKMRDEIRQEMNLQPRIVVPKKTDEGISGFQA
ncbi:hypothetical protein K8R04_03320 [Candidatus Uhrbacteria bacterium]|nr:hypothetical protein [Candidatus Uhrbacteria bacterium]